MLGYVRTERLAFILGTSFAGDSFILAYRIPNLFRRLVAEGAMSASFIPVFAQWRGDKEREEWIDFANRTFWTLSLVLAAITVLGVVFSPLLVRLFTWSGSRIDVDLATLLNRVMWPYLFFVGLSALLMAFLNSFRIFAVPALASVMLNLSVIAFSFLALRMQEPSVALAIGVLVGGLLQLAIQVPSAIKQGMTFRLGISFRHPAIRRVGKLMLPGFAGYGVAYVNFAVGTIFATHSLMPEGALMSLEVADRVMELVLGGYAIAIATAILPLMSEQVAERNMSELKQTISFSLRLVSFITIPAMVGLVILRQPIIQVLFERGRFTQESTAITAWALLFYAIGLPWFAAAKIIIPAFYSTHDTRTPVKVAAVAMVANIAFNFLFLYPLRNGGPAAATSLAGALNFVVLYWIFRRRHGLLGTRETLRSGAKVVLASAAMGVAAWLMLALSGFNDPAGAVQHSLALQVVALTAMLAIATGIYFFLTWLMRCDELRELYGIARRRPKAAEALPGA